MENSNVPGISPRTDRVMVEGLSSTNLSKQSIADFFGSFGKIEECKMPVDHITGASKGYAFITYCSESAIEDLFNHTNVSASNLKGIRSISIGNHCVGIKPIEPSSDCGAGRCGRFDDGNIWDPQGNSDGDEDDVCEIDEEEGVVQKRQVGDLADY